MAPKHHNPKNENIYHGYFPFLKGDPSHKEFLDLGRSIDGYSKWEKDGCPLYESNPWKSEHTKEMQQTLDHHFNTMHSLALTLIRCLAVGLGKKEDFFDPWFKNECSSTLRGIHYMPRTEESLSGLTDEQKMLVTPEHTDSGFITLLSTFMYPGL